MTANRTEILKSRLRQAESKLKALNTKMWNRYFTFHSINIIDYVTVLLLEKYIDGLYHRITGKYVICYQHEGIEITDALEMVGQGWSEIILKLYQAKPPHVAVEQVKEKYGTLRFYVDSCPRWYDDLIQHYENETGHICEVCGAEGTLRTDGWWRVRCDDCEGKLG